MARLLQKPKVDDKKQLAQLQTDIFEATARLEEIGQRYVTKYQFLETEFSAKKAAKQKEVDELENKLAIMQSERLQLEKPIEYKRQELNERETKLSEHEQFCADEQQRIFEREREAEHKLEDVQSLSDQLGETRVRLMVKEKLLKGREDGLKDKENGYLIKIDNFSHEVNEAAARIQERENAVHLKELNVESKEENLIKREKELLNGFVLLTDQRGTLARAWKELKKKQYGSTKRPKR